MMSGLRSRMRTAVVRRPAVATVLAVAIVGLAVRIGWLLVDHRLRLTNDSGPYLEAARAAARHELIPFFRERADLFTVLWAPLLDLPRAAIWIMVLQGVVTVAAGVAFALGLHHWGVGWRAAAAGGVVAVALPQAVYYEHVLMGEAFAYAGVLLLVALTAWAVRPRVRPLRLLLPATTALVLAGTVRTSFLVVVLGAGVAAAVVSLVAIARSRSRRATVLLVARAAAATLAGVLVGMVGASLLQGAASGVGPFDQIKASSGLSAFNSAFKFGNLVDCVDPVESPAARSICADRALMDGAQAPFDHYMWMGSVNADWESTSTEEFTELAAEYRAVIGEAVLADPLGAAGIVVEHGSWILLPVEHDRFTTSAATEALLPRLAPAIHPSAFGVALEDPLYRAASLQDPMRLGAAVVALVLLVRLRRERAVPAVLLIVWIVYVTAVAVTAAPTVRFLMPTDPLLVAVLAVLVAVSAGAVRRSRTSVTSPTGPTAS